MSDAGWNVLNAENAAAAKHLMTRHTPNVALIDYMLPDANGVELAAEFVRNAPSLLTIVMSGIMLPPEEEALCEQHNFPILVKPFLASEVIRYISVALGRPQIVGDPFNDDALEVFFCYSHRDEDMRNRLDAHLSALKHMGIIRSWHDRKIAAGADWDKTIDKHLNSADLVLLLISPDFLNSEYAYRKEMKRALERHDANECRVIPVILRPADWETAPFAKLQAVPKNGKPITSWTNRDTGYLDAAKAIRKAAEELSSTLPQRARHRRRRVRHS